MQEQDMPREMLVAKICKQVSAGLAQLQYHPRARRYANQVSSIENALAILTCSIPAQRARLEEQLSELIDSEDEWLEYATKALGLLEFKLEKPEDWGTRRE